MPSARSTARRVATLRADATAAPEPGAWKILVAHDFRDEDARVLAWAAEFARPLGVVSLVHVANTEPLVGVPPVLPIVRPFSERDLANLRRRLALLAERYGAIGRTDVIVGAAPGPTIVEHARHVRADLVITGTHGFGAIRRTLFGDVADHAMHHAPCPVITVRQRM